MESLCLNPGRTTTAIPYASETVWVVDDVFLAPEAVAEAARRAPYEVPPETSRYPGLLAPVDLTTTDMVSFLSEIIEEDLEHYSRGFSFNRIGQDHKWSVAQRNPHVDSDRSSDFAGLVYLNEPQLCHGGTAFYAHCETGLLRMPNESECGALMERFDKPTRESLLAWLFAPGGKRGWHPAFPHWKKQYVVPMRYNRLVFYRSHLFHSAEVPPEMPERQTMTFFLRQPDRKPYRFVRLPDSIDPNLLGEELTHVEWQSCDWDSHYQTQVCVLRGGEQGLEEGHGQDQPILSRLPGIRRILDRFFPVPAQVAWLGYHPPGARIFLHSDARTFWKEHHRIHIPLVTHEGAQLCADGNFQHLPAGSVWAFNNTRVHGCVNEGPARIHLMVDLPMSPEVEAWLATGVPVAGQPDAGRLATITVDRARA